MKFSTPIGATFGNRAQWRSPAVVWMTAVGSAVAAAAELAGLRTGGFVVVAGGGVEAACAAPSREVEMIRTSVCSRVRMGAPVSILASFNCTTVGPVAGGVPGVPARPRCCCRRMGGPFDFAQGRLARRPSLHSLFHRSHFAADLLGVAEDAENIAAQDLADVVGAVAAVEQGLRDFRQVGGGIDAIGSCAADAVKIRAQPDMLNTRHFRDMVDVIDQRAQRRARNFGGPLALDAICIEVGDRLSLRFEFVGVGLDSSIAVFDLRFSGLAVVLVDEGVVEIYLDDAAVLSEGE